MRELTPILPDGWGRGAGFSWGMAAQGGRLLAIAGQLATRNGGMTVESGLDFVAQFGMALQNVVTVVTAAGGKATDIMMLRAYVRDMNAFKSNPTAIRDAWQSTLGKHYPAMTMIEINRLFDDNALVEIDGFAVIHTD